MPIEHYFQCRCGRHQPYSPPGAPGGITRKEAEFIGWKKKKGHWICPLCTDGGITIERFMRDERKGLFNKKRKEQKPYSVEDYGISFFMK